MKYLFWPFLRFAALALLVVLTVSGFLRTALRALTGANQIPPSRAGCWMQAITLPLFAPIAAIYHIAVTLYLWVIFFDVKLGFTSPEEGFALAFRFHPDPYADPKAAYAEFLERIHGSKGEQDCSE